MHIPLSQVAVPKGLVGGPFGSSLGRADYMDCGVPVIRGSNMVEGRVAGPFAHVAEQKFARDLSRNTASPGDLVYTQRGTLGQVAVVPEFPYETYVISQSQMRLRVDPSRAVPAFVYYASLTPTFMAQIDDHAIRTGVPHINLGILSRLMIPAPPLPEQQAIAEVLGALDDKIAANRARECVSRELIKMLYHRACVTGSEQTPLMQALRVTFGEPFAGAQFSPSGEGRPLLRIRDIARRASEVWTTECRPGETLILPGKTVAGMDAEFTPSYWLGAPSLLNQRVCLIEAPQWGDAFALEMAAPALLQIAGEKSGTTVIHLNKSDLERVSVLVPTPSAKPCADLATHIHRQLVKGARETVTLATLRDTLLPALMDSTIRVKDAISQAEQVL